MIVFKKQNTDPKFLNSTLYNFLHISLSYASF